MPSQAVRRIEALPDAATPATLARKGDRNISPQIRARGSRYDRLRCSRECVAGEVFVPFGFMQQTDEKTVGNLTERETQVLRGLCEGKSNKEIARDLDLQEVTIKLHVKTLCRKLDAKNRTQAAMIAKERRLV